MPQREDETPEQYLKRAATAITRRVEQSGPMFPVVRDRCRAALLHDGHLHEAAADEAAFHLADWIGDLVEFNEMLVDPNFDPEAAYGVILAFLAHAPHHLVAAAKIVYGYPTTDVFELGAVKGSGRAKRKPGERHKPAPRPERDPDV